MGRSTSVSIASRVKTEVLDYLLRNTLGRVGYFSTHSPQIEIIGNSDREIADAIEREAVRLGGSSGRTKPSILDIGARRGAKSEIAKRYKYHGIDIKPKSRKVIHGDICSCPQIKDNSFDVVFSTDVFEHVQRPWDAAKECVRIAKPGGLLIHRTLFAYRYHPVPEDYWRFTSQGLEYLFTGTGEVETIKKGYDIRSRRRNHRGHNLMSKPPIDWMGGFRENWKVLWIGRKL